jgi:uroporphyrinogen-III synthase
MRVLIPELAEDAAPIAAALAAQGHAPLATPLVSLTPAPDAPLNLSGAQAFLVTSPAAARALAARVGVRTFPAFADSALTAATLHGLGFKRIEGAPDAQALAALVASRLTSAAGALIHPCATGAPSSVAAMLTNMGFAVRPLPLYGLRCCATRSPAGWRRRCSRPPSPPVRSSRCSSAGK